LDLSTRSGIKVSHSQRSQIEAKRGKEADAWKEFFVLEVKEEDTWIVGFGNFVEFIY